MRTSALQVSRSPCAVLVTVRISRRSYRWRPVAWSSSWELSWASILSRICRRPVANFKSERRNGVSIAKVRVYYR